ncbi:MAG: hypothetical protein KIH65_003420 [Candidatus Uhrbacteria bacterium]|nr:hypothetical protein [Candidatus Uhrbacteria bacterium]
MLAILIITGAAFFLELSSSIGKVEIQKRRESMYAMGFLSMIWGCFIFGGMILARGNLGFDIASLPTFGLRAILEIFQAYVSLRAISEASRTTYSFIHAGTVPIILIIDLFLMNAPIGGWQIIGMAAILGAMMILSFNHGIDRKGLLFVILSTVNAAITISLYKYDISHFNSVEGEQFLILLILLAYFTIAARVFYKERPWQLLKKPVFLAQSATYGIGHVLDSFAYLFGVASVITVTKRAASTLWALVSGRIVFHEKNLFVKITCLCLIVTGIVLLNIR